MNGRITQLLHQGHRVRSCILGAVGEITDADLIGVQIKPARAGKKGKTRYWTSFRGLGYVLKRTESGYVVDYNARQRRKYFP